MQCKTGGIESSDRLTDADASYIDADYSEVPGHVCDDECVHGAVFNDKCECGDCAHEDCDCDDHCGENHSCSCDDCSGHADADGVTPDGVAYNHEHNQNGWMYLRNPSEAASFKNGKTVTWDPKTQHGKTPACTYCGAGNINNDVTVESHNMVNGVCSKCGYESSSDPEPEKTYTLTINHVLASGSKWPEGSSTPPATTTQTVGENQDYYVTPLTVPGMTATPEFHSGNIGTSDKSVTFTYSNSSDTGKIDLEKAKVTGLLEDLYRYKLEELSKIGIEGLVEDEDYSKSISKKIDDSGEDWWVVEFEPKSGKCKGKKTIEVLREDDDPDEKLIADEPAPRLLTYNGKEQIGVSSGTGFYVQRNWGTNAGTYFAKAILRPGYTWSDGSTGSRNIMFIIKPATIVSFELSQYVFKHNKYRQYTPEPINIKGDPVNPTKSDYITGWDEPRVDPGTYTVTVSGTGNFTGVVLVEYIVCGHTGERDWEPFEVYKNNHIQKCRICGALVPGTEENCTFSGKYTCKDENVHYDACTKCGRTIEEGHTMGERKYYKWEKPYVTYFLYYKQECTGNCGLTTDSVMRFNPDSVFHDITVDYSYLFDSLCSGERGVDSIEMWAMYREKYMSWSSKASDDLKCLFGSFTGTYKKMFGNDSDICRFVASRACDPKQFKSGKPIETTAIYKDARTGELKSVPIDTSRQKSDPSNLKSAYDDTGITPDLEPIAEGEFTEDSWVYYDVSGLTKEEIESITFIVNAPQLEEGDIGEHTLVNFIQFLDEDGNTIGTTAAEYDYTIAEVENPETGNKVKGLTNIHPDGLMQDGDNGVVSMSLASETVAWTGETEPVSAPVASLKLLKKDGTETLLTEGTDYTLKCYRFNENVTEGSDDQLTEVNKDAITGVGQYRLEAVPVEGSALSGTTTYDFRVAYDLAALNAQVELAYTSASYTGEPLEPDVTVTANVGGENKTLKRSDAWSSTDGNEYTNSGSGDYKVTYEDNVNEGTAKVTVTGEGLYTGTLTAEFTISGGITASIEPVTLKQGEVTNPVITVPEGYQVSRVTYTDETEAKKAEDAGISVITAATDLDGVLCAVYVSAADDALVGTTDLKVLVTGQATDGSLSAGTATLSVNVIRSENQSEAAGETWNLFEDGSDHVYSVSGLTSKTEVSNSNKNSAAYFDAVLSKDKITVKLKSSADRKKAAAANTFDFDLGEEGTVSYTLPFTYNKPVLKLSSTKGTVKKGKETSLKTTVLVQSKNGDYEAFNLSGATVYYGKPATGGDPAVSANSKGQVTIAASSKASDNLVISKTGWNEKDPVQLKYTITEVNADKDVLEVDLGGLKQIVLNTNADRQIISLPLTLNGEPATSETVTLTANKKEAEDIAGIGNGTLDVCLGWREEDIKKGTYTLTVTSKTDSKAKVNVKVKVSDKALSAAATGKVKQKIDVVTGQSMVVEPSLKEVSGQIKGVSVTVTDAAAVYKDFEAAMNGGNINVTYTGTTPMDAKKLKIGNMKFALTVDGIEAPVEFTVKNVTAKKTTPKVKASKVIIPKSALEKADGTTVIAAANILSTYGDSAKHTQTLSPADVKLEPKNVDAVRDESDYSRILIRKLTGKSGSVKATLTYAGGVTKTVTIKVTKGK